MKKNIVNLLVFIALSNFSFLGDGYRYIQNDSFSIGENYVYKIKFGFVNIGVATVNVTDKVYQVNGRPCYRINVLGRTAGITDLFKVRNTYISYLDTLAFVPHQFIYSAREGNFKRDQTVYFNQQVNKVTRVDNQEKKYFNVPKYCQDVVSGYYFLRTIEFEKMRIGEIVEAPLFFADELYNMKVKYNGKKQISTKFGKINVVELNPILPPNDLFNGSDAIKVFVSDDKNRVPIELYVDFKFGSATMELKQYKNQRHSFRWI